MYKENINILKVNEVIVDRFIEKIEFDLNEIDLRNLIYYFLSFHAISPFINKGFHKSVDSEIEIFTGIYSNCIKKLNSDINESLHASLTQIEYRDKINKDIFLLGKYKALCNLMPAIHKENINIYRINKILNSIHLDYKEEVYLAYECRDILFTRINLICDFNIKFNGIKGLRGIAKKYYSGGYINIDFNALLFMYKRKFNKVYNHYKGYSYLLCDDFLYSVGGFYLIDFNKFLTSMHCINGIEKDLVKSIVLKEGNVFLDEDKLDKNILRFYNKKMDYSIFKKSICSFSGVKEENFEKIIKYFLINYDEDGACNLSGDDYIVPFLKKEGILYFNTIFNVKMISPRNLIYAMNKYSNLIARDKVYNSHSKKLELKFLKFMRAMFESYGLNFYEGKNWKISKKIKGEIDAIVVCNVSKTLLIIQTKTVIAASNYRTVSNLQSNMYVAIEQIQRFNDLDSNIKNQILKEIIGEDISAYNIVNCVNSDGGIGTALIWDKLYRLNIVPFNMAIIVKYFNEHKDLLNFKTRMYLMIEELTKSVKPELRQCEINFYEYFDALTIFHDDVLADYDALADDALNFHKKISEVLI